MGRSMVYYCEICGEELKQARARFCTLCGRLYYNVRRLKSASIMTETALFQHIMHLKSWQRFRGHVFRLSNCENYIHPLYANPGKNLSVRVPLAAGSPRQDRMNRADHDDEEDEGLIGNEDPEFPDDENDEDGE